MGFDLLGDVIILVPRLSWQIDLDVWHIGIKLILLNINASQHVKLDEKQAEDDKKKKIIEDYTLIINYN